MKNNPELSLPRSTGSNKLSTLFIYFVLSPLLCAFSGFHMTGYLLVGLYTWPRTSRVIVLTIGTFIFVYEFIFKSQAPHFTSSKLLSQTDWILYTSLIPFVCGVGVLVALARFSE